MPRLHENQLQEWSRWWPESQEGVVRRHHSTGNLSSLRAAQWPSLPQHKLFLDPTFYNSHVSNRQWNEHLEIFKEFLLPPTIYTWQTKSSEEFSTPTAWQLRVGKKTHAQYRLSKVFLASSMKWHFILLFLKILNCQQRFMSVKFCNSYEQLA